MSIDYLVVSPLLRYLARKSLQCQMIVIHDRTTGLVADSFVSNRVFV